MSAVDFAAVPPELTSNQIYAGAGAGPLVAAASAWDGLAAELGAAVRSYQAVISDVIGGSWLGPSSQLLAAAAAQFVTWLSSTVAQVRQTANQIRAAIAAYEAAFAATVPPPLIAANRALLALLVVTNVFGQNAAAIASTEAQYSEYWAQDAGVMYTYAAHAAAATTLPSFNEPQQNTNPTGVGAQTAAVSQATSTSAASNTSNALSNLFSAVPNSLQQLASGLSFDPSAWLDGLLNSWPVTAYENINYNLTSGYSLFVEGATFLACGLGLTAAPPIMTPMTWAVTAATTAAPAAAGAGLADSVAPQAGAVGAAGLGGDCVSAGLGEAASVAGLSVPPGWATASPEIRLAAASLHAAGLEALPAAAGAGGWFNGVPVMGNMINASRGGGADSRSGSDRGGGRQTGKRTGVSQDVPGWSSLPNQGDLAGRYSERDELNELRKVAAELAKERDVLKRSASLLINEATQR